MHNNYITASYLFAPQSHNVGKYRCFYCGLPCNEQYTKKEYVKKTFTNRDIVKFPGSNYVCGCCVVSMATIVKTTLVDGEIKTGRGGAPRTYSWILSQSGNTAFSKKHLDYARSILECPPNPPFSIIFSDSGKKQIIFRAPINYNRNSFVIQFEEEHIYFDLSKWNYILKTATIASAAIGKKALLSPNNFIHFLQTEELYGSMIPLKKWITIHNKPMAKIAAWICKGKKDARNDNIVSTRIQTKISRSYRLSQSKTKQRNARGN